MEESKCCFRLVPPYFHPCRDDIPRGRSGHSMCANETDLYLFGGYSPADERNGVTENTVFPELWRFNFAQQKWTQIMVVDTQTTCLSSCMLLNKGKLFLFGGTGYPFAVQSSNSLRILQLPKISLNTNSKDIERYTCKWKQVDTIPDPQEDENSVPPPDYGQSMILHGNNLYIFAGAVGFPAVEAIAELYCLSFDSLKWTKLNPSGKVPSGRYKQETVQDSEYFYVLGGGRLVHSEGFHHIDRYSFSRNHWSTVTSLPDPVHGFPKSRVSFGCVKEGDNIYISGGRHYLAISAFQELEDMWHLRLSTLQWTRLSFNLPEKMFFHRTVMAPSGFMYMFGGVLKDELRSAKMFKIRLPFTTGKLSELCWEKVCDLFNDNHIPMSYDILVEQGVPWNFIERVGPIPA